MKELYGTWEWGAIGNCGASKASRKFVCERPYCYNNSSCYVVETEQGLAENWPVNCQHYSLEMFLLTKPSNTAKNSHYKWLFFTHCRRSGYLISAIIAISSRRRKTVFTHCRFCRPLQTCVHPSTINCRRCWPLRSLINWTQQNRHNVTFCCIRSVRKPAPSRGVLVQLRTYFNIAIKNAAHQNDLCAFFTLKSMLSSHVHPTTISVESSSSSRPGRFATVNIQVDTETLTRVHLPLLFTAGRAEGRGKT